MKFHVIYRTVYPSLCHGFPLVKTHPQSWYPCLYPYPYQRFILANPLSSGSNQGNRKPAPSHGAPCLLLNNEANKWSTSKLTWKLVEEASVTDSSNDFKHWAVAESLLGKNSFLSKLALWLPIRESSFFPFHNFSTKILFSFVNEDTCMHKKTYFSKWNIYAATFWYVRGKS